MDTETQLFLDYIKVNNDIKDELISVGDDFNHFVNGLTLNNEHFTYIGFYEENTKNIHFYIQVYNPSEYYNILHNAWQLFHDNDYINVKHYIKFSGEYYNYTYYKSERKYLYKYLMNMFVDKLSDK
jgi:hypothetical protein